MFCWKWVEALVSLDLYLSYLTEENEKCFIILCMGEADNFQDEWVAFMSFFWSYVWKLMKHE